MDNSSSLPFADSVLQDLRYAARTLYHDAGFTTFAVLIVALGIGASATVFSLVNTLLLRPLPFHEPERLVWISNKNTSGLSGQTTQVGHLLDLREQNRSYSDVAGYFAFYGVGDQLLRGDGEPERLSGVPVSENFFQVLGIQPVLGRLFTPEECKWHGPKAVLLSHGLWIRRFNADQAIVGRKLTINDEPVTVAGVLPASFDLATVLAPGSHFDLYTPFPLSNETNRWGNTMAIVARLKPGATVESARAELKILAPQIARAHPERNDFEGNLKSLAEQVSGRLRPALLVLACAVGVVMLIVCANLSNLLLARSAVRQKEMAIRSALGADRMRLIRQMLTESLTLSCAGALVGTLLAAGAVFLLAHTEAFSIPLLRDLRIDPTVLLFCVAAAALTGVLFGLAPALHLPAGALPNALKDATRGSTGGKDRSWLRNCLVVAEISFACVLLVGAGLLVRSFLHILDVDLGFRPDPAAAVRIDPDSRVSTHEKRVAYYNEALRRAREVPGVVAAGLTDTLPLGRNRSWGARAKGQVYTKGTFPVAYVRIVSDGYLRAMGIAIIGGRDFTEADSTSSEPVIIVNQTLARRLWPGQDPLGQKMLVNGECRVVGVVADVRHLAVEQSAGLEMYLPIRQIDDVPSLDLVMRTSVPPADLAAGVRSALRPIAPDVSGKDFRVLQQLVDRSVSPRRFIVLLLGGFAGFALLLASLGIYALISYAVSQRAQEFGIRMALGAPASALQASILGQTLRLAGIGICLGVAASFLLARILSGLLFGVTATDPLTFASATLLLIIVAAAAGYLPARHASRVDPAVALRAM
jgi:predicted permease